MSLKLKSLAGELNIALATLYTCPANTKAYIKTISCYNKWGATARVRLFKKTTISWILVDIDLEFRERLEYDDGIVLEAGESLEGQADNNNSWDYSIEMSEEDLAIISP